MVLVMRTDTFANETDEIVFRLATDIVLMVKPMATKDESRLDRLAVARMIAERMRLHDIVRIERPSDES